MLMKIRWIVFLALVAGCARSVSSVPSADKAPEAMGTDYGNVTFPAPVSERSARYLGLKDTAEPFRVCQVSAGLVVVEIFDMYCIYCQRAAPEVNQFYREIERSGLGDRIKVVGVGRKNSEVEVDAYRERYEVEFPLFPDPRLSVTRSLGVGDRGTPHFVVLDLQDPGKAVLVDTSVGAFGNPETFLDRIRKQLRGKEE
jgi:thiol-disulfide isomerase/thioredoxin